MKFFPFTHMFEGIAGRQKVRSTIATTNLPFCKWIEDRGYSRLIAHYETSQTIFAIVPDH